MEGKPPLAKNLHSNKFLSTDKNWNQNMEDN